MHYEPTPVELARWRERIEEHFENCELPQYLDKILCDIIAECESTYSAGQYDDGYDAGYDVGYADAEEMYKEEEE